MNRWLLDLLVCSVFTLNLIQPGFARADDSEAEINQEQAPLLSDKPNFLNGFQYIEQSSPGNVQMLEALLFEVEKSDEFKAPQFAASAAGVKYAEARKVVYLSRQLESCLPKRTATSDIQIQQFFAFAKSTPTSSAAATPTPNGAAGLAADSSESGGPLGDLQNHLRREELNSALFGLAAFGHAIKSRPLSVDQLKEELCATDSSVSSQRVFCGPEMEQFIETSLQQNMSRIAQNKGVEYKSDEEILNDLNGRVKVLNQELEELDAKYREAKEEKATEGLSKRKLKKAARNIRAELNDDYLITYAQQAGQGVGSLLATKAVRKEMGNIRRPNAGWIFHRKDVHKDENGEYEYTAHKEITLTTVSKAIDEAHAALVDHLRKLIMLAPYEANRNDGLISMAILHPDRVGSYLLQHPEASGAMCPIIAEMVHDKRVQEITDWALAGFGIALAIAGIVFLPFLLPIHGVALAIYAGFGIAYAVGGATYEGLQIAHNLKQHKKLVRSLMADPAGKTVEQIVAEEKALEVNIVQAAMYVVQGALSGLSLAQAIKSIKTAAYWKGVIANPSGFEAPAMFNDAALNSLKLPETIKGDDITIVKRGLQMFATKDSNGAAKFLDLITGKPEVATKFLAQLKLSGTSPEAVAKVGERALLRATQQAKIAENVAALKQSAKDLRIEAKAAGIAAIETTKKGVDAAKNYIAVEFPKTARNIFASGQTQLQKSFTTGLDVLHRTNKSLYVKVVNSLKAAGSEVTNTPGRIADLKDPIIDVANVCQRVLAATPSAAGTAGTEILKAFEKLYETLKTAAPVSSAASL